MPFRITFRDTTYRLALFGLLLFPALPSVSQTIRYVATTGTNANPATATTWASSTTDLQGAINASNAGDQVRVATGTYKPGGNANRDRNVSFAMKDGVTIYGGFAGSETSLSQRPTVNPVTVGGRPGQPSSTTLSGNLGSNSQSYHVVYNPPALGLTASAVLDGFVIANGLAEEFPGSYPKNHGAGLLNAGDGAGNRCSPTVRNVLFANSTAYAGGAVANSAQSGGTSQPTFENCVFQSNRASFGGAVFNTADFGTGTCSPTFRQCFFQSNTALLAGGALYLIGGNGSTMRPLVVNSRFLGNSAASTNAGAGGAVYINNTGSGTADPRFVGCSFENNTAGSSGGAFENVGPFSVSAPNPIALGLTNCSFRGNNAPGSGSVLSNQSTHTTLTNCVVWGNTGAGTFLNQISSTTATYSLFDAASATGLSTSSSTNLTTASSPYAGVNGTQLAANSPAINTGNTAAYTAANGPASDLAGNVRIVGTGIDMGAYESGSSPLPLPVSLLFVNGRMTDAGALLAWATAREADNAYFQVERSPDARSFESIGRVLTLAPNGTSQTRLDYAFTDPQPLPGTTYYRLVQVDQDGTKTTSRIVALTRDGQPPVLYPNPVSASGEAVIEPAISHTGYVLSDVLGREVQRVDAPGVLSRVSLAELPAGVYLLRVQTQAGAKAFRLLR